MLFKRRTVTMGLAAGLATFGSLVVPPSSAQAVGQVTFSVKPAALPAAGGRITLETNFFPTASCSILSSDPAAVVAPCNGLGRATYAGWIPPTGLATSSTVTFTLHARVALTDYTKTVTVTIAGDTSPTYVALGDSFASGEGNPQGGWVDSAGQPNGSDGANDGCDRSLLSYPKLTSTWLASQPGFQGTSFGFYACSGDTTTDIFPFAGAGEAHLKGAHNGGKEPFQLINTSALSRARIVTLMAGGDDLNFADVLKNCILSGLHKCNDKSDDPWIKNLRQNIHTLEPVLEATYRQAKATTKAAIYVVGYPRIFATNPTKGCAGLSLDAIKYLAPLQENLNAAIKTAAQRTFVNYVEPKVGSRSFDGHDVCSSDPWFNQLNAAHQQYSFHPNGPGQMTLALAVQATITSTHAKNPPEIPNTTPRGIFLIPAGHTATISNVSFNRACDSLTYGYQVIGGVAVQVDSRTGRCLSSSTAAGRIVGPFSTARSLRIWLRDTRCKSQPHGPGSWTYFSDGNHTLVSGTGPWALDLQDSFFCLSDITSPFAPKQGQGDLHLTLSIS